MMSCVLHHCCRYGLIPNTARGKSALVLALGGAGSRAAAAAAAFSDDAKTITVTTAGAQQFTVHVEASYLHLGGMLSRDGDMTHEARRRASVFDGASKRLLLNRYISLQNRAMLFCGLVTSTYHNLELWTSTESAWPQLQRSYDRLHKKLLSCDIHGMQYYRLTPAEAFHITGQQPLPVKTRLKRVGFLCNMVRHGGPEIWAIIQAEHTWALQVWQDLDWVRQWAGDTLPALTTETWPVWWHILAAPNGTFKMKAKRAARRYVQADACRNAVTLFLKDLLKDAGFTTGEMPASLPQQGGTIGALPKKAQTMCCLQAICHRQFVPWYLSTRHLEYPSLGLKAPGCDLFHVLRCCWRFLIRGGSVFVQADPSFWQSEISRPFQAMGI